MDKNDFKLKDYDFGQHYSLQPYNAYMDEDVCGGSFTALAKQFYVGMIDKLDDMIVKEIIRTAQECNVTDVLLLNKENINTALRKATPMEWNGNDCPVCGTVQLASAQYCHICGQRLKHEEDGLDD